MTPGVDAAPLYPGAKDYYLLTDELDEPDRLREAVLITARALPEPRPKGARCETSMLCLIFDLDGTLVDSEPLATQAFLDLLPQLDDTVPGLMRRYTGLQFAQVVADLSARLGHSLPDDFEVSYRRRIAQLYDTSLAPMPGAVEMLSALQNPRCVASNGPVSKMTHGLRVTGLAGFFGDKLFSAYQVGQWKPEPHLFLHAARAMNVPPEMCLVIEDSDAGLQAAKAAGMRAVQFSPTPVRKSDLAYAQVFDLRELANVLQGAPVCGL